MKKFLALLIFVPIGIVLIVLSVANRQLVTFSLDPINSSQPFLAFELPFFVFLFVALLVGLVLGGMATWFTQGKHRKLSRQRKHEADQWHQEADVQKERAETMATLATTEPQSAQSTALSITSKLA